MDTSSLLANLDNAREDQYLEFKEAGAGLPHDVWETYSAFANTEGGCIVLGVKEDRSTGAFFPEGVADAQGIIADFWSTLRNPQQVERDVMLFDGVSVETIDGKDFVIIEVPRAERSEKPVRVFDKRTKQFVAWVRRGEADFKAADDDLRLMHYDGIPSVDRKPLDNFGLEALCDETVRRYRQIFAAVKPQSPWVDDSDEDFLYHIGALAKGHDGALHPTQAGLLAFGYEYEITNYAPQYLLDYREEKNNGRRWEDRIVSQSGEWSGNLIDFYYMVTERLLRSFKAPYTTDETGMVHGVANPVTEAVNEAVANALVHAYYGSTGSVRVILTGESLKITNPGTFLMDREVAIAGGFSEARNPTLMRIFSFVGASDRAGSGLQQIWSVWQEHFGEEPTLNETHLPSSVSLELPIGEVWQSMPETAPSAVTTVLTDSVLLELLHQHPSGLTSAELQAKTGASQHWAQVRLKALYEQGLVTRVKEGRSHRYMNKTIEEK